MTCKTVSVHKVINEIKMNHMKNFTKEANKKQTKTFFNINVQKNTHTQKQTCGEWHTQKKGDNIQYIKIKQEENFRNIKLTRSSSGRRFLCLWSKNNPVTNRLRVSSFPYCPILMCIGTIDNTCP